MGTFIDLFCGCGGWTQGLRQAGWTPVLAIDCDRTAMDTFVSNHSCPVLVQDIAAVKRHQLPRSVDLVVASPPCQSFSTMGKRLPAAEDNLFKHVVRIAAMTRARRVLVENVVGFTNKPGSAFDILQSSLRRHGYQVQHSKLNAADFGVPQRRHRIILAADRNHRLQPYPNPALKHQPLSKMLLPATDVPKLYWLPKHRIAYFRAAQHRGFARFIPYDTNDVAPTIMASYMQGSGESALIVYTRNRMRKLTEAECSKLQSFPATYRWRGSRSAIYKQIGNAVPPRLAYHLGTWLLSPAVSLG